MSDNYDFEKSSRPQDIDDYSPYTDKQYNGFINDLNGGVYTNTSLSLVQFDLGQIYNSQKFTNTNDLFMVVPVTMVAAFSTGAALVAPVNGNAQLLSTKTNFIHLIHQADIQINGKTIESTQSFVNIAKHFQMISEMSVSDLATIGNTLGFGDCLDNPRSARWCGNTAAQGIGFTNNDIIGFQNTGASLQTQINAGVANTAIQSRLSRFTDVSNNYNGIAPTILTETNLQNECKPTYKVLNNYMIWYDYAVIRLSSLFESLANIGLVRKFDCTIRLWFNTGTVNATIANPNSTTLTYSITSANNTFTNTCPFTINHLADSSANGGIPGASTTNIVAGLYISKPPTTSFASINLASSGASHPLPCCRMYYSQIALEPTKALTYINENRNKKVVYRTILTNQYNNITAGGNFNQLINSGIIHPTGILICPYVSSQQAGLADFAWKNPFDTCPATGHPISLINLQVSVGGVNQLQSTLYYTYENFVEQVNLAEALTSSDFGISCGLYNQSWWEMFRYYFVNIERSAITDKNVPRNINVSFTNNTQVPIDVLVFIFYSDEFVCDIETGLIRK